MIGKDITLPPSPTRTEWTQPKDVASDFIELDGMDLGQMRLEIDERKGIFAARAEILVYFMLRNGLGIDPDGLPGMFCADVFLPFFLGWKGQFTMSAGQLIGPETV